MPKEHAGGALQPGIFQVPAEWSEERRTAVKIDVFNFESLDSLDDLIREELRTRGTAEHLFHKMLIMELHTAMSGTVVFMLSEIIRAKDAGLAASQMAFASGMMLTAAKTGTEMAAEFGITKQAWEQGVNRYRKKLGLRKTRNMRDEAAKALMAYANYRPKELRA